MTQHFPLIQQSLRAAAQKGQIDACTNILRQWIAVEPEGSKRLSIAQRDVVRNVLHSAKRAHVSDVSIPSVVTFAHVAGEIGAWEHALEFMSRMKQLGRTPSPLAVASLLTSDNFSYVRKWADHNALRIDVARGLAVLAQRGTWDTVLRFAQEMERSAFASDRYSVAAIVPYLANGGHWDQAMSVLHDAIRQGYLVHGDLAAHVLLSSATSSVRWAAAMSVASCLFRCSMISEVTNTQVYQSLINVSPNWVFAMRVLSLARMYGVRPDKRMLGSTLSLCDRTGQWQAASYLFDRAVEQGFVDSLEAQSYHVLMRSFHASTQWRKAVEALSWMNHAGVAASAAGYLTLIDLCDRAGRWEVAVACGVGMLDHGEQLDPSAYISVIQACARGQQWVSAVKVFLNYVNATATGSELDQRDAVQTAANQQQQRHPRVDNVKLSPVACLAVLQACASAQQWTATLRCFRFTTDMEPHILLPQAVYTVTLRSLVSSMRWTEALRVLNTMPQHHRFQHHQSQQTHPQTQQRHGKGMLAAASRTSSVASSELHLCRLGLWVCALCGAWRASLSYYSSIGTGDRTRSDTLMLRRSVAGAGPIVQSIILRRIAR